MSINAYIPIRFLLTPVAPSFSSFSLPNALRGTAYSHDIEQYVSGYPDPDIDINYATIATTAPMRDGSGDFSLGAGLWNGGAVTGTHKVYLNNQTNSVDFYNYYNTPAPALNFTISESSNWEHVTQSSDRLFFCDTSGPSITGFDFLGNQQAANTFDLSEVSGTVRAIIIMGNYLHVLSSAQTATYPYTFTGTYTASASITLPANIVAAVSAQDRIYAIQSIAAGRVIVLNHNGSFVSNHFPVPHPDLISYHTGALSTPWYFEFFSQAGNVYRYYHRNPFGLTGLAFEDDEIMGTPVLEDASRTLTLPFIASSTSGSANVSKSLFIDFGAPVWNTFNALTAMPNTPGAVNLYNFVTPGSGLTFAFDSTTPAPSGWSISGNTLNYLTGADGSTTTVKIVATDTSMRSATSGNLTLNSVNNPTPVITALSPASDGRFQVQISFSEVVTGFELSDIEITNGTGSSFESLAHGIDEYGRIYSTWITPQIGSDVTITVPAGVAMDSMNQPNEAASLTVMDTSVQIYSVPSVPRNLSIEAGDERLIFTWSIPHTDGNADITDYEVRARVKSTGVWESDDWVSAGTDRMHTFTGLTNDTEYELFARARNSQGAGESDSIDGTPVDLTSSVPSAPILFYSRSANGNVELSWFEPSSTGGGIIDYEVSVDSGAWVSAGTNRAHTFPGVNNQEYIVRIRAKSAGGYGPSLTFTVTYRVILSPLGEPENLAAASTDRTLTLTFDAPSSGDTQIEYYQARITGPDISTIWVSIDKNTRSYAFTNLTNGYTYTIYVRSFAVHDLSDSVSLEAHLLPAGLNVPSAPRELIIDEDDGHFEIVWKPPISDGGSPITGYEHRLDGGTWNTTYFPPILNFGIYYFHYYGLVTGQTYMVDVRARNANGAGVIATVLGTPRAPDVPIWHALNTRSFSASQGASGTFDLRPWASSGVSITVDTTYRTLPTGWSLTNGVLSYIGPATGTTINLRFIATSPANLSSPSQILSIRGT